MTREKDEKRDQRIENRVMVDAYTAEERALGWYYYLEAETEFPFRARCVEERTVSPLREGADVHVVGMADEGDCMREMFVLVEWRDRVSGVPLAQLEALDVDSDTREAIEDWQYWYGNGGQLH